MHNKLAHRLIVLVLMVMPLSLSAQQMQHDKGEAVWELWCEPCHAIGSRKHPGTQALQVKYRDTDIPAALEERTDLTAEIIEYYVRNGISMMPFFRKTEISDTELADLAEYLTGDE